MKIADLFGQEVQVVCLGLPLFYDTLESNDVPAVWVEPEPEFEQEQKQKQNREGEEE